MANYIKTLQDQNQTILAEKEQDKAEIERLKAELAKKVVKKENPYDNLSPEDDMRQEMIEVRIGNSNTGFRFEKMTRQEAFDKMVEFYSGFTKPTDRSIPRVYADNNGIAKNCNTVPCYIRCTFKDLLSGQQNILIRDVPLWLAVDKIVNQGQNVELITHKEFMDWRKEMRIASLKNEVAYQNEQRGIEREELLKELRENKETK